MDSDAGRYGLKINTGMTKGLEYGEASPSGQLVRNSQPILKVDEFICLRSMVNGIGYESEIRRRMGMAYGTLAGFDKVWKSHEISL